MLNHCGGLCLKLFQITDGGKISAQMCTLCDGTHYFSETLDEHNRAVVKFQKSRVINYRSSPDLQSELMPAEESVLTPVATPVAKPLASPIAKPIGVLETTEGDK